MEEQKQEKKDERLAQAIEEFHFGKYLNIIGRPGRVFWLNFVKGVVIGFGTIIGVPS